MSLIFNPTATTTTDIDPFVKQNIKLVSDIDTGNSTTSALLAGATFTGVWKNVKDYTQMTVSIATDQDSAVNGLEMQFSSDSVNVDRNKKVQVLANGTAHTLVHICKFFRLVYTNGGTNQTYFRMQCIHSRNKNKELTSTLTQSLNDNVDVQNVRATIVAKKPDNTYNNLVSDYNGHLQVVLGDSNLTAFDELATSQLDGVLQETFSYNINTRKFTTVVNGTGTADIFNRTLRVQTGTTTGSDCMVESRKKAKYRPGLGLLARFTGVFSEPDSNGTMIIGVGDTDDGFFFGYNGLNFGVLHRNSSSGVVVDTWIYQANWDADKADGTQALANMDWQTGIVFEIRFQFLGYGQIKFYVEDSVHPGALILVHSIDYNGQNTNPSLSNPTLPFCSYVENGAGTANLSIRTASCGFFVEGKSKNLGEIVSFSNSKSGIGSTETNILTWQNKTSFASVTNKSLVFPQFLNVSTIGGTKPTTIKVILNPTLGGTPSYTDIDTNTSVSAYDTAGTTITNGSVYTTFVLGKEDTVNLDLAKYNIFIDPGDILTVSASTPSGSVEVFVSITVREDI